MDVDLLSERLELAASTVSFHLKKLEDEREAAYRQKILDTFFKFNQLKSIPVQRKKWLVVLEHMVDINEKLMTRESNIYKRVK